MSNFFKSIQEAAKSFAFKYTSLGVPTYCYNIEPIQLATLINEIERLKEVKGNIVEIGVARGLTTRLLCQHIINQKLDASLTLYAVDTFDSFTNEDLDYEVQKRGKILPELKAFGYNDFKVWKKNFSRYPFVQAIQSDCSIVNYAKIGPIKLAFLDVDLYLPTKKTLVKLYEVLVDGGVILVDDVLANNKYDGAYQAYMEFCDEYKIQPLVIGNKCGLIYKNNSSK
jgi:hypothetical protein